MEAPVAPPDILEKVSAEATRREGLAQLAARLGYEGMLLFAPDPFVSALLPMLGLPQTLPQGLRWRSFVSACLQTGAGRDLLVPPGRERAVEVQGVGNGACLVAWGALPHAQGLEPVRPLLPMLARIAELERRALAAQAAERVAEQTAQSAQELMRTLSHAHRNLQSAHAQLGATRGALEELVRAGDVLVRSLEVAAVAQGLVELCVPAHGVIATLDLLTSGGEALERAAVACAAPAPAPSAVGPGGRRAVDEMVRTGGPRLWRRGERALDADLLRLEAEAAVESWSCFPLMLRERTIGTLLVGHRDAAGPGATSRHVLGEIAARAAVAIDNARLHAELKRANDAKDDFIALLGHELRNPLAAIVNAAHLLGRADKEDQRSRVQRVIQRQSQQLTRLVDEILDTARIVRRKVQLQVEALSLDGLLRELADDMRPSFLARGVELVFVSSGEMPVRGDRVRLTQVFGNLLGNALKFTPSGGTVRLLIDRQGERIRVEVADSGTGFAPEMAEQLFAAFAQGDRGLAHSEGGLGLGLAVARGLVELHQGTLRGTSPGPGRGATFTVELPAAEATHAIAPAPRGHGSRAPRRILVVDDNTDVADMVREALLMAGHDVEVANDGSAALSRWRAWSPEIVLCDIGLPVLDGYEIARRLRADGCEAYLVAMSGYGQESDRRRALDAGFELHLTKPVELERLLSLVEKAFSGRRSRAAC